MLEAPEKHSPLGDMVEPGTFGPVSGKALVELSESLPDSLVQIQAWPDSEAQCRQALEGCLGVKPAKEQQMAAISSRHSVLPTGPGRWIVVSDGEEMGATLRDAIAPDIGVVTDLTHGRVALTISGAKAAWVLASGVALNFDEDAFPVGAVRVARHHEIGLTIHRTTREEFTLYVFTSFARAAWHWLTTSAEEVGYQVV